MFLAIDIGNSNITFGVFKENKLLISFRASTQQVKNENGNDDTELIKFIRESLETLKIKLNDIKNIGISSVVPSLDGTFLSAIQNLFEQRPFFIGPSIILPFKILTDNPLEVGADRLCGITAGIKIYSYPLIIVDFGTATTYDVISAEGNFIGGVIAPGIYTSAKSLFSLTEKLFEVPLEFPKKVIGTNTKVDMQSGIMFSAVEAMEGILRRIFNELQFKPRVIATGGFSKIISEKSKMIDSVEFDLVLKGIKLLYEFNN